MMIILIIVGLIILLIGVICLCTNEDGLAFFLAIIGAWCLLGGLIMYGESCEPTAMDVYKGKTTLEITYKDGVPVDSVVVFKDKEK